MSVKNIGVLYFYLVSAGALVLIVIGIFNSVNLAVNLTQYQEYPLRYFGTTCETYPMRFKGPISAVEPSVGMPVATPSAQELKEQKEACLKQESEERKRNKLDDVKNSITFSLVGVILFLIHFPQAQKARKE